MKIHDAFGREVEVGRWFSVGSYVRIYGIKALFRIVGFQLKREMFCWVNVEVRKGWEFEYEIAQGFEMVVALKAGNFDVWLNGKWTPVGG